MRSSTIKCMAVVLCAFFASYHLPADEIIWSGAYSSTVGDNNDLSLAANWTGGVRPGENDIAVFDMTGKSHSTFKLSEAMSVKGIDIRRTTDTRQNFSIVKDSALLTIGEAGVKAQNVHFIHYSKVSITGDSTWQFYGGKQLFTSHANIGAPSADTTLMISNVDHYIYVAVKFPGTLFYGPKARFSLQTSGAFAREVKLIYESADGPTLGLTSASNEWSSVFTGGTYRHKDWAGTDFGRGNSNGEYPLLVYREGDWFDAVRSDNGGRQYYFRIKDGTFRQASGRYKGGSFTFVGGTANVPTALELFGGSYWVENIYVGYGGPNSYRYPALATQLDGTAVTNSTAMLVGASGGVLRGLSLYDKRGGDLLVAGTSDATNSMHGLILSAGENGGINNGVFTQSAGTTTVNLVRFGAPKSIWGNTAGSHKDGFGLLDIAGGLFRMNLLNRYVFSPKWMEDPGESNYRVSLHGGTLRTVALFTNNVQLAFPPTDRPGTWETVKDVRLNSPLYGNGHFRKTGAGAMYLDDATRFTGTLEVKEGTMILPSTGEQMSDIPTIGDDSCFVWTADKLAETLADGGRVESWADDNQGITAVSNGNFKTAKYGIPSLKKNSMNGHASVRFSSSVLTIPKTSNVLAGNSNVTIVCVMKNEGDGNGSMTRSYEWAYCHGVISGMGKSADETEYTASGFALSYFDGSRYTFGVNMEGAENYKYSFARSPVALNDGKVHVAIAVKKGAEMTLYVDGSQVSHTILQGTGNKCNFKLFSYADGTVAPRELHFGINMLDAEALKKIDSGRTYQGWISEIRFYTNRVFTVAEQQKLGRFLLNKYAGSTEAAALLEKNLVYSPAEGGSMVQSVEPTITPKTATARWCADDLSLGAGAAVSAWTSSGTELVASAPAGAEPEYVPGAVGGHDAVRFDGSKRLKLAADDSPLSGKSTFAVSVVFRTQTDGFVTTNGYYHQARGMVSCWQGADNSAADFAMGLANYGTFVAGCGGTAATNFLSRSPCWLHDGLPHVVIANVTSSTFEQMIDGVYASSAITASARGAMDLVFGAMGANGARGFVGDIAEIRIYDAPLTREEMTALSESAAQTYAFRLAGRMPVTSLTAHGLAATNIIVREGAVMRSALSETNPYVVNSGSRLQVDGEWRGTASVNGGKLGFSSAAKGGRIADLRLSGAVTFEFPEGSEAPSALLTELLDVGTLTVADGTTFVTKGLPPNCRIILKNGKLVLHSRKGAVILIR